MLVIIYDKHNPRQFSKQVISNVSNLPIFYISSSFFMLDIFLAIFIEFQIFILLKFFKKFIFIQSCYSQGN